MFDESKKKNLHKLSDLARSVTQNGATERAFTSALNEEHRKGVFTCAVCDKELFKSTTKYNSGTGWPSFYDPMPDALGTKEERGFFSRQTEVHCADCGAHMGHVFGDGPKPTGQRYCINGVSLGFTPDDSSPEGTIIK